MIDGGREDELDEIGIDRSERRDAAFEASRTDRDRTLEAIHAVEAALDRAAPGREGDWIDQVMTAMVKLDSAISRERKESNRPDSLLSIIAHDYPRRCGGRVRQLREQFDDITQQVSSLMIQLDQFGENADVADLRERLSWLMRAIRHSRARETDLVFEAINLDLGRSENP
jgi:hypothetical protein